MTIGRKSREGGNLGEAFPEAPLQESKGLQSSAGVSSIKPSTSRRKTLADLRIGHKARVLALHCEGMSRRRLLDLGLLAGTEVKAVRVSPAGGVVAYDIRGAMLALRREDASKVEVDQD